VSRNALLRLQDMVEALAQVQAWITGETRLSIESNPMLVAALIRNLEVVGEAAKSIPAEIRALGPQIPWSSVGGFRDVVIHQYFRVDLDTLWDVAAVLAPDLEARLRLVMELVERLEE
jgi:uncharacterized protein with HEPN domain